MGSKGGAPPGERNGLAKMTDEKVIEMRERYARGEGTHLSLAIEYDIAPSTAGYILNGKTWKHLPGSGN